MENQSLSNKLANLKLKNSQCVNNDKQFTHHQYNDIANRVLYLQYVEKVLNDKQNELIEFEKILNRKQKELNEIEYRKGVGKLIEVMQQIKMMQNKLKYKQIKNGIKDEQYIQLYKNMEIDINKIRIEIQKQIKKQFIQLINEKKLIRIKISKFEQLQLYQKYLNQLHQVLQIKNKQLSSRQSLLENHQINSKYSQFISSDTKRTKQLSSSSSTRKRIKIFNGKNNSTSEQYQNSYGIMSNQKYHNQTFAKNSIQEINLFHDSNSIIQEESKHDYSSNPISTEEQPQQQQRQQQQHLQLQEHQQQQQQQHFPQNQQDHQEISFHNDNICRDQGKIQNSHQFNQPPSVQKVNYSVQVNQQTIEQTQIRLKKQALIVKYATKWIKAIIGSEKCAIYKKKAFVIDLWRLNTIFDERISEKIKQKLTILQNMWIKEKRLLYESKMFPYNELSLKRRKYNELMFDYEKKIYYRNRIQNQLKLLIRNKNRKQRLIFYYYFCKFIRNSCNLITRSTKKKYSIGQTRDTTGVQSRSQLIEIHNNQIKSDDKLIQPLQKSILNIFNNKSNSSSIKNLHQHLNRQLAINQQYGKKDKQNLKGNCKYGEYEGVGRMKKIIEEKEKTQKLLATHCVKLEGLIKMVVVLLECSYRTVNYGMKQIAEMGQEEKINDLTIQMNGVELKLDVLMTKCKLGIVNNSNKISIIENLLDFNKIKK